jgi:hypothetical protein
MVLPERRRIDAHSGATARVTEPARCPAAKQPRYYVDVPAGLLDQQGDLIDQLIGFAFDTLGAARLELRVRSAE